MTQLSVTLIVLLMISALKTGQRNLFIAALLGLLLIWLIHFSN